MPLYEVYICTKPRSNTEPYSLVSSCDTKEQAQDDLVNLLNGHYPGKWRLSQGQHLFMPGFASHPYVYKAGYIKEVLSEKEELEAKIDLNFSRIERILQETSELVDKLQTL